MHPPRGQNLLPFGFLPVSFRSLLSTESPNVENNLTKGEQILPARTMLSEKQQEVLVNRVNADIDLPFVGEESEGRLIEKVVQKVAPIAEQSFRMFLPDCYVDCLKIALDEKIDIQDRRRQITSILRGEIAEPLARSLNANCDAPFVPERVEAEVFEKIAEKLVEEMVC